MDAPVVRRLSRLAHVWNPLPVRVIVEFDHVVVQCDLAMHRVIQRFKCCELLVMTVPSMVCDRRAAQLRESGQIQCNRRGPRLR